MLDPSAMVVEELGPADLGELAAALAAATLPTDDVTHPSRRFFRFWTPEGAPIGFIGAEQCGPAAVLVRSLVVLPDQRGHGWSPAMVAWLVGKLAEAGITDAWMLTTTIASLAERLGFARVAREQAPAAVRGSRQFATLCPASAVLLHRRLP